MICGFLRKETKRTNIGQKGQIGVKRLGDIYNRGTAPSNFPKKSWILERISENQIVLKGNGTEEEGTEKAEENEETEEKQEEVRDQRRESRRVRERWEFKRRTRREDNSTISRSLKFLRKWKSQSEDEESKLEKTPDLKKKEIEKTREPRRKRQRINPRIEPNPNLDGTP